MVVTRRHRNMFHKDVSGDASTKVFRRGTSRDDCRTSFLSDASRDDSRCITVEMPL